MGVRARERLKPEWMEGLGPRNTVMGNLYNFHPDEWKNVALPVVECISQLLKEVYKLHMRVDSDSKVIDRIEKLEREHHERLRRDI